MPAAPAEVAVARRATAACSSSKGTVTRPRVAAEILGDSAPASARRYGSASGSPCTFAITRVSMRSRGHDSARPTEVGTGAGPGGSAQASGASVKPMPSSPWEASRVCPSSTSAVSSAT